jgi:hypothetical protein
VRNIPAPVRKYCLEKGILSKSLLLQVARQPNDKKMAEMAKRIVQSGLTRDQARQERREEKTSGPRPQPFIFQFKPEGEAFSLRLQFRKSQVSRDELISTLRSILDALEHEEEQAASHPAA